MKIRSILLLGLGMISSALWAQTTVKGTVTEQSSGDALPGVAVVVDGKATGVFTSVDGAFSISADPASDVLVFSFAGFTTQRVTLNGQTTVNVSLESGVALDEVVVTALGVSREKKALGYAVQELGNESFTQAKNDNVVRALSGKVAGVQVTSGTSMGSSSKVLLRGASSITGDNQPLFVVDGVPIDNSDYSSYNQQRGAGAYDYGNTAADINPEDIESVTVLKGPAAAALYGSRASNGAIVITTKSGKGMKGKDGLGIEVNSGVAFNDVLFLPDYQNSYGGGAGPTWIYQSGDTMSNGAIADGNVPDMGYDGSWGPALDGSATRHWDSWYEGSDTYGEIRPWEANPNNVADFFQTGVTYTNNVAVSGASAAGNFRLSYTNHDQTGIYENSSLERNTLNFNGSSNISEKLKSSVSVNYVNSASQGRPLTGYGESIMSQFTQWGQRQLDDARLRDYKNSDGTHRTWNRNSITDGTPHYWDNPYWERFENVQNDSRNRLFGNVSLNYKINDNLSLQGRSMVDYYTDRRQERIAVGGVRVSSYSEQNRELKETNHDLILNYTNDISEDVSLTGFVGVNQRNYSYINVGGATQGGLNTPGYYSLLNSVSPINVTDFERQKTINSAFGSVSLGINRSLYLDFTGRNDWSSTLPEANNSYFYPSATASYVFSEVVDNDLLDFGKIRLGWAQVGNDTDPYRTSTTYAINPNFGSYGNASVPNAQNNPNLRPEKTSSLEVGVEATLLEGKVRFDGTYYNSTTEDLIFSVTQSASSGYTSSIQNAGKVNNKGVELMLEVSPVVTDNFRWDIGFNYAKNTNELLELADGVDNLRYASLFGVTLEARPGEALGTFYGYNYVFDADGNKLVDADGYYLRSDAPEALGSILPDFTGGVTNTFTMGNLSLYALIDFQKGGSLHSLSNQWGKYSGTLYETVWDGDGNDIRADDYAGVVVDGVTAAYDADGNLVTDENGNVQGSGEANTVGINPQAHFFYNQGYVIHAADQYDASFVKLREIRLNYNLPASATSNMPFSNVSVGLYGRNLAILHKNVPHIDPEVATSASNIQGFEGGQLPTERTIGVNLKFTL
ncbi:MAG: SusC/RagA family TonB-linked outer membrane protein [Flavobacteriales bacterium]